MAVPAFSFTSRAVPVAQIGRIEPIDLFAEVWVDIGCDVHEITTDTGRGSASDRFVPGTAVITASNVSGWASGTVPLQWSYFADDFARSGPVLGSHWRRWGVLEADRGADELVIVDEAATVQAHPVGLPPVITTGVSVVDTAHGFGPVATSAPVGPFTGVAVGDVVVVALAVDNERRWSPISFPGWKQLLFATLTFQGWQYEIHTHRITAEEVAVGDPWTATWLLPAPWTWVGWVIRGSIDPQIIGGDSVIFDAGMAGYYRVSVNPEMNTTLTGIVVARIAVGDSSHDVVEGGMAELVHSTDWPSTLLLAFDNGGSSLPFGTFVTHRTWNWTTNAVADGEYSGGTTLLYAPGSPPPPDSVPYEGASCALWDLAYAGDQFIEATVGGLTAPERMWPSANARVELALNANAVDLSAHVAVLDWVPDWDDPTTYTGTLTWQIVRRNTDGTVAAVVASGTVDYGAGGFPPAATFRFETDAAAEKRLYLDGVLLGAGVDAHLPLGEQIGIFASYSSGSLSYGRTVQMGPPRFDRVVGGSNIPTPIYLEPGVLVRIGVDHQVHGLQWFFHGYVDAIVPVYDPTQQAVARIECIDALGEIGRLPLADIGGYNPEEAWERITRLADRVSWPPTRRDIADDATLMFNESAAADRAVELLTQTAESCGGAVYGDPQTGHLVFRGCDWQAWDPDLPPDGYITNNPTPSGALATCPSTWERSWRREDMTTRVTFQQNFDGEHGRPGGLHETFFFFNPEAETRFGIEPYERALVSYEARILHKLGARQLSLRGPGAFPRVNAVLLDAATGDGAIDVMTLSTFTAPSRYQCGLTIDGAAVFNRQYLVTGVRHTITRDRWQCRLELDIADVFATKGARWGRGHWGVGVWGRSI